MIITNYKLTIAIPTYNRKDTLLLCLDKLFAQIDERVEVLVSDNASTDGTQLAIGKYTKSHTNLTYIRNKENLGPDKNFLNCYEKASGEYVLLIGDDDFFLPGAVEHILNDIECSPVFIHLNTCAILDKKLNLGAPRLLLNQKKAYTDKNEFFKDIGIYITFMSSLVVKREYICEIENKEQFIGSYFIQSHLSLLTLCNQGLYIVEPFCCIAATSNKTISYDLYYVWVKQFKRLIIDTGTQSGFDTRVLEEIYYGELQKTVLNFVLYFRRTCKNQKNWDKNYIWENIEANKKLTKLFKSAVNCPKIFLLFLKVKYKVLGIF